MWRWLRPQFYHRGVSVGPMKSPETFYEGRVLDVLFLPHSQEVTVRTVRPGPSRPSPEYRREIRATMEPMLSIFPGLVKHLQAVLMDTLELCMERSGAVLGCALLSSHHFPFSVLVPYLLPNHSFLWKSCFYFLYVSLFGQALGSSMRNSAGRVDTTCDCGAAHENRCTEIRHYKTFPAQVLQGKLFVEQRSPNPTDPEFLTPLTPISP